MKLVNKLVLLIIVLIVCTSAAVITHTVVTPAHPTSTIIITYSSMDGREVSGSAKSLVSKYTQEGYTVKSVTGFGDNYKEIVFVLERY